MKADRWLRHLAVAGVVAAVAGHVWMDHARDETARRETERVGSLVEEAERRILRYADQTNPDLSATLRLERDRRIVAEKRIQKLRQMVMALQVTLRSERQRRWIEDSCPEEVIVRRR